MTQTVEVKSNIGGRLKKIRDGVVFNSADSVIGELMQNAQRALDAAVKSGKLESAEAGCISITFPDARRDTVRISDNGTGCDDPQMVLELDVSGFGIGFGEGFSSVFLLADRVIIQSHNWAVDIDVNRMMDEADYIVPVLNSDTFYDGFGVTLVGPKVEDHHDKLLKFTEAMGSMLPYPTFINTKEVKKKDFSDIGKTPYKITVDNELFSGTLGVTNTGWQDLQVYYENRYVCGIWKPGVIGNIMLKPGAVNLKTPDRREIIYDAKRSVLSDKIQELTKQLYSGFLEHNQALATRDYAERITEYLEVDDYIPFLEMDVESLEWTKLKDEQFQPRADHQILEAAGMGERHEKHYSGSTEVWGGENLRIDGGDQAAIGTADPRYERSHRETEKLLKKKQKERQKNHEKFLKKLNGLKAKFKVVWASAVEVDDFDPVITELKSFGFTVLTAKNKMYEAAFRHLDILHFKDVESNVYKKYDFTNIGAQNPKEQRVLWLLERIEEMFQSPGMFRICDITCKIEHYRNNRLVGAENKIVKFHYDQESDRIYIDRKSLELPSFRVDKWDDGKLNMNDLRLMMKNLEPLAKEVTKFKNKSREVLDGFWDSKDAVLMELVELF
jgi:hypothetical protein